MPRLPRQIALINQKGGVGKTTTTANLGAALARAGRRVLMIDLDPQSHLTMHLGVDPANDDRPTIYEVLTDGRPIQDAIRPTAVDGISLAPATIDLAAAEVELVGVVGREVLLRDALAALRSQAGQPFDYLLLDCPPSLGLLTLNALSAAEEVIICLQPHFLALQGVGKLLETVSLVHQRINAKLSVTGVVLCMYDLGTRLAGEVTDDLAAFLDQGRAQQTPWSAARIFKAVIRRNIKLAECPSFGQVIFQYAPSSHGAQDYALLGQEVMAMETGAPAVSAAGVEAAPAEPPPEARVPEPSHRPAGPTGPAQPVPAEPADLSEPEIPTHAAAVPGEPPARTKPAGAEPSAV